MAEGFQKNETTQETSEQQADEEETIDEEENVPPDEDEDTEYKMESQGPHFSGVEAFLYISVAILGDLGDSVWIFRFFFGPATILWLWLKGVRTALVKNALAQVVEMIPAVGWLPISTVTAILTVLLTNHPEYTDRLGILAKLVIRKGGGE